MLDPLYVAKPLLPSADEMKDAVDQIWASGIVTNLGPYHQELERRLSDYLGATVCKVFNNGTSALMAALDALELPPGSEVITTPLTFPATAHAIRLMGHEPVFADVDADTLTIDPDAVKMAITDRTAAVIGVHVYGTICDVGGLQDICDRHRLKLVFDAAHAFGSTVEGTPVGMLGDVNAFSMHATKLYSTLEGGVVTSRHPDMAEKLKLFRNFGIENEDIVSRIGMNGKMNEMQAAVGVLSLPYIDQEKRARERLRRLYDEMLKGCPGIRPQTYQAKVTLSEQYYPVVIDPARFGRSRDKLYEELKSYNIFARKYFAPICTDMDPYREHRIVSRHAHPVIESVKRQVLCLPFHSGVTDAHVAAMIDVLRDKPLHARTA